MTSLYQRNAKTTLDLEILHIFWKKEMLMSPIYQNISVKYILDCIFNKEKKCTLDCIFQTKIFFLVVLNGLENIWFRTLWTAWHCWNLSWFNLLPFKIFIILPHSLCDNVFEQIIIFLQIQNTRLAFFFL